LVLSAGFDSASHSSGVFMFDSFSFSGPGASYGRISTCALPS
jgi:hypothetical protein